MFVMLWPMDICLCKLERLYKISCIEFNLLWTRAEYINVSIIIIYDQVPNEFDNVIIFLLLIILKSLVSSSGWD